MNPKYKHMLRVMEAKEKKSRQRKRRGDAWFLYILKCRDGKLYTGIAKDLQRRFKMHQAGKASRFTRTRLPVKLLYQEQCVSRTAALVRECAVKALPRKKKQALISSSSLNRHCEPSVQTLAKHREAVSRRSSRCVRSPKQHMKFHRKFRAALTFN